MSCSYHTRLRRRGVMLLRASSWSIRSVGGVACSTLVVLSALAVIAGTWSLLGAANMDDAYVVTEADDIDGDGVADVVVATPTSLDDSQPGEVIISLSASQDASLTLRGVTSGDWFGYSAAVVTDLNGDSLPDLFIGAPRADAGLAYVFHSPFTLLDGNVILADQADVTLQSPLPGDFEFGERVAAAPDFTGDGVPELRVRAWYHGPYDVLESRTYFFDGATGAPLFAIVGEQPIDPWQTLLGDANGDGVVDQADVDLVLRHMGLAGEGLAAYGDVNGDGVVDALDLGIVLDNLGSFLFDLTYDSEGVPHVLGPDGTTFIVMLFLTEASDGSGEGVSLMYTSFTSPCVSPLPGGIQLTNLGGVTFGVEYCCCDCAVHSPCRCEDCGPCSVDPCSIECETAICDPVCPFDDPCCDPNDPWACYECCTVKIIPSSRIPIVGAPYVEFLATITWGSPIGWSIEEGAHRVQIVSDVTDMQLVLHLLSPGPVTLRFTGDPFLCSGPQGCSRVYTFDICDDVDSNSSGVADCCESHLVNPPYNMDPIDFLLDSDNDGLYDWEEVCIYNTDPKFYDTDGDGLPDGWEVMHGLDPHDPSDAFEDPDGDGILNIFEFLLGTDPNVPNFLDSAVDADGDGIPDWIEIMLGTNPNDPTDFPSLAMLQASLDPSDMAWMQVNNVIQYLGSQGNQLCECDCFRLHAVGWASDWHIMRGNDLVEEVLPNNPQQCVSPLWCITAPGEIVIMSSTPSPNGPILGWAHITAKPLGECEPQCATPISASGGGNVPGCLPVDGEISLLVSGGTVHTQWLLLNSVPGIATFVGGDTGPSVTLKINAPGEVTVTAVTGSCAGGHTFNFEGFNLSIDSDNNNGYNLPDGSEHENAIKDDPNLPGKLILINNADRDGDGIPGFADGINLDPTLESGLLSEDDRFVPIRLSIARNSCNPNEEGIVFSYDASPPSGVEVIIGPDGPSYLPAPGALRIWTKDGSEGRDMADVADGGDFVAANRTYAPADLGLPEEGGEVVLWIEAVRPSETMGDARIVVKIGDCEDAVRLTAYCTQFTSINADGSIGDADMPRVSLPSPVITTSQFELVNVRTTEDQKHVLADMVLAGTINDAISNLRPGPDGVIDTLHVRLNGAPAVLWGGSEPITVDVNVSKQPGGSLLAPHEYHGSFGTVVEGVEVQPGWNTVQLIAQNSAGYTGYAERAFELRPIPPPDVEVHLWLQFYDETTLGVAIDTIGGGTLLFAEIYHQVAPGVYELYGEPGSFISLPPGLDFDTAESFLVTVDNPPLQLSGCLISVTRSELFQPIFEGSRLFEERHRPDWTGFDFELLAVTDVGRSLGGVFEPFVMEVLGPPEIASWLLDLSFTSQFVNEQGDTIEWQRLYEVTTWHGRHFLSLPENERPEVMLALPSQDLLSILGGDGQRRDGAWNFTQGVGHGLYDTGVDLVDTVGAVAKLFWYTHKHYNFVTMYRRLSTGGPIILEEDQQRLDTAWSAVEAIAGFFWQLRQGQEELVYAMLTGDVETLNEFSEQTRLVLEISAELIEAALDAVGDMDDYDAGRIAGRITGEVTLEVVLAMTTGGAGNAAKKSATMASVINKLDNLPTGTMPPAVKAKFDELLQLANQLGNAKAGEKAESLVVRIRKDFPDLDHWDTFIVMLDKTNAPAVRRRFDNDMHHIVDALMEAIYKDAVGPGGVVDLTKVKSVQQMNDFRFSQPLGQRLHHIDLHNHHTIPRKWAKAMYRNAHGPDAVPPGGWKAWEDSMPGFLMHRSEHIPSPGASTSNFHKLLNKKMKDANYPTTTDGILNVLEDTYSEFSQQGPNIWAAGKKWLQNEGLTP